MKRVEVMSKMLFPVYQHLQEIPSMSESPEVHCLNWRIFRVKVKNKKNIPPKYIENIFH